MELGKTERKRRELVDAIANHLLAEGLHKASLRTLAAAAKTSDRMLLHYFRDKEELMSATLPVINQRLVALLDSARAAPMPMHALLAHLAVMIRDPQVRPYIRLWIELAAQVSGGDLTGQIVGQKIGRDFLAWIAAGLQVENEVERDSVAALTLATLEGMVLLDTLGLEPEVQNALRGLALSKGKSTGRPKRT